MLGVGFRTLEVRRWRPDQKNQKSCGVKFQAQLSRLQAAERTARWRSLISDYLSLTRAR
jgi:hypothetical protein